MLILTVAFLIAPANRLDLPFVSFLEKNLLFKKKPWSRELSLLPYVAHKFIQDYLFDETIAIDNCGLSVD